MGSGALCCCALLPLAYSPSPLPFTVASLQRLVAVVVVVSVGSSHSARPSWSIRMSTEMPFNLFNNDPNQWLTVPALVGLPASHSQPSPSLPPAPCYASAVCEGGGEERDGAGLSVCLNEKFY